jgi:molecular chaperone DnaJ
VAPHAVFVRKGRDLLVDLELSITQAALGDNVQLNTLDGEATVTIPPGTQPGATITLRGQGLPDVRGGRGNLHVIARVTIPKQLTAEQRAALAEFARLRGETRSGKRKPILRKVKDLLQ